MSSPTEEVWRKLVEFQLCPANQAELLKDDFKAAVSQMTVPCDTDDARVLCDWLVEEGEATPYQTEILLGKSTRPLRVGPYQIIDYIEAGRLAGIYRARHHELQFPVCLKLVPQTGTADEQWRRQALFQREARVSVQADHPHIVQTYQIGQADGFYFIAFENLIGQSLMELIRADSAMATGSFDHIERLWDMSRGHTRPEEVCRMIHEAALGLAHLHEHEIVHRDVTPRNLWVSEEGHIKVLDFGMARDAMTFLDAPVTDQFTSGFNEFLGSVDYLSPEQALDPDLATHASDIYGLGCTLYHALTGRVPYDAKTPSKQMILHALGRPALPSTLNDAVYSQLDEVCRGMMGTIPEYRYLSAQAVAEALEPFISPDDKLQIQEAPTPQLQAFLSWLSTETATAPARGKSPPARKSSGEELPQYDLDDDPPSSVEDSVTEMGRLLEAADAADDSGIGKGKDSP